MSEQAFNKEFLSFLQSSPTPFHAVESMVKVLADAGFNKLNEHDEWQLTKGHRYYLTRNDSSIIAFVFGKQPINETGIRMAGAHTDSPCLRVKPNADVYSAGYHQLGLEVYGGVLLAPWFDRDLSMAGRVSCLTKSGTVANCLVDFERPVALIPSLAIHLDREANSNRTINKQTDLPAIMMLGKENDKGDQSFKELLAEHIKSNQLIDDFSSVLDHEISLYDTQPPALIGLNNEFIASARLDNLLSCFAALKGLLSADAETSSLLVCNDHEEVGSSSAVGANGPMLADCISRMCGSKEDNIRAIQHSMMVSADNAHGIHPNYASKHDDNHGPLLNEGVVIKVNANQRYASNSATSAHFRQCASLAGVPLQTFVVRSDMGCGSTIGPITAKELGVATVDVGAPTFGMHSIRETAGSRDAWQLSEILAQYFKAQAK